MDWTREFEPAQGGPDKVLPLNEAIAAAVRPGMTLHFAFTHNRPAAAMAQLLRQFRGQNPGFTMVHMFTAGPAVALITEGLVQHLVTTLICEPYPSPSPSRPARRALAGDKVKVEHWSVLSFIARLQAAALGLPVMPVRSLLGSTLERDNSEHLEVRREHGTVEVAALRPDLSFVHVPCADRHGNALLAPPLGEGTWGALAAREGVVVTAERIVSTDTLHRCSHLTGIPASRVRSVSEVPLGAHPAGLASAGIPGVEPYGDDMAFYASGREAGRTAEGWARWVAEWLADPPNHDAYTARLGPRRILELKGKARPDSWRPELLSALNQIPSGQAATRPERMTVSASRLIARKVRANGLSSILCGFGAGSLAAWLAHSALARDGDPPELLAEVGMLGYTPRPCDPFLFNFRNLATCTLGADSAAILGIFNGGAGAQCLGSLGAGQVDGRGNFNSTRLADGTLLVGSGGANDVSSAAREVVITIPAGRNRLVSELPYVTGTGQRVTAVVTDLGVFEKEPGAQDLRLTRLVLPLIGGSEEDHVRQLQDRAGFRFETAPELGLEQPPGEAELKRLRLYDPGRAFLGPLEPGSLGA